MTTEGETSRRLGEFLEVANQIVKQSRAEKLPTAPSLQEMLDELRGNDE